MNASYLESLYIRVPGGFGDNLMATAVIAALKREYTEIEIIVATKRDDIFKNNPHISKLYNTRTLLKKNMTIYNRCSVLEYPQYAQLREARTIKHLIDYFYDCLPIPVKNRTYQPELFLSGREANYKHKKMQKLKHPIVVISPYGGATSKIPNKFYPAEKWPAIVKALIGNGFTIIQLGRKKEGPAFDDVIDFRNKGYRKSAAILLKSDLLITHPSGFMHLATALSVPCMTLFGGVEDPEVVGYSQNPDFTVTLECAPCWLPVSCDDPKCRKEIMTPENIVAKVIKFANSNIIAPNKKDYP